MKISVSLYVVSLICVASKCGLLVKSFSANKISGPSWLQCHVRQASSSCLSASRRTFIQWTTIITGCIAFSACNVLAIDDTVRIPLVTADEFYTIARDSGSSIEVVEFSGPKSETVRVKLLDGTVFGIKGIIESSTDPRSPFKIAAVCRENKIPVKFKNFETALQNSGGKKKIIYANSRVQEAAIKEREKELRMQQDESNRLAELERLEQLQSL